MARFTNGWVKFYRETVDGDIGEKPFLLGLFVKLLLWANWRESNAMFNGERMRLQPGQLITGLRELSPDVDEDPYLHRVRNALAYLEKRGTITQLTGNRGRLITICNWSEYQVEQDIDRNSVAIQGQAGSNLSANGPQLIEEVKKGRREEIYACVEIWGETLSRMGIQKSANLDEGEIGRLIQRHGLEKTKLALLGAGFEAGSDKYDPKKHVSIRRLQKPDVFETFVNLGAQHKPVERKAVAWELPGVAK